MVDLGSPGNREILRQYLANIMTSRPKFKKVKGGRAPGVPGPGE